MFWTDQADILMFWDVTTSAYLLNSLELSQGVTYPYTEIEINASCLVFSIVQLVRSTNILNTVFNICNV